MADAKCHVPKLHSFLNGRADGASWRTGFSGTNTREESGKAQLQILRRRKLYSFPACLRVTECHFLIKLLPVFVNNEETRSFLSMERSALVIFSQPLPSDDTLPRDRPSSSLTTRISDILNLQLRTLKVTKYQQYFFDNSQGLTNSRAAFP
jgi:hypothetical protein